MKTRLLIFLSAAFIITLAVSQFTFYPAPENKSPYEVYSEVKVHINSPDDIQRLVNSGITVDHYHGDKHEGITLVINQAELEMLKASGVQHTVVIANTDEYYRNRPAPTNAELTASQQVMQEDNIRGLSFGTMGGYHTYSSIVAQLDTMRMLYPTLITAKQDRGTTHQGRKIWSVKISDNADVNESATEPAIYFDALIHAREPQAMACLMYFMYWLLENYNTNPEAKYLVDNREIYFIPVVNPDGYVKNETTNPGGGGMWRRNGRTSGPNPNCGGVDLNRNFNYGWGNNSGSSPDSCSDTYRGPSAGSEPETQAVKNVLAFANPKIGFNVHSVAGRYLNPYGYNDSAIAYEIYSDFSGDFAEGNNYTYGTVNEMLDYYSSGTARDWMHVNGCYGWTPEVGGSGFWPTPSEIFPIASEMLLSFKYLSWVGGAFAKFQNYTILNSGFVERNDTLRLNIGIRNKGLSLPSNNVTVDVTTSYPNIAAITANNNYGSISQRQLKFNTTPFAFRLTNGANYMDEIKLIVSTKQEGVETSLDTISVIVGDGNILVNDNAETGGINKWTRSGNQIQWDTTYVSYWGDGHSFADSRYGNSRNSTNNQFTLKDTVNLIGAVNPRLEFMARWATETTFDYARIQVSTNFGSTWTSLTGRYTATISGQPSYHGIQPWIYERINLTPYVGQRIRLRFLYVTDGGVPGDGFYFDNFRVVNYTDGSTGINPIGSEIPRKFELYQNYPNPFNPVTKIKFDIPKAAFVKITVFDILGREVNILANQNMNAGSYEADFDASLLTSGVYFYKIEAGDFTSIRKMMLVK